jgi:esterase
VHDDHEEWLAGFDELAESTSAVRRVRLDGASVELSALRWGAGTPDLVFLHGGGQNAHTFDRTIGHLRRPALSLDLPGHGRSGWYEVPDYLPVPIATDVHAALREVAGRYAVVGMSLGGFAAAVLAARYPDVVERLVLVDVSPNSTPARSTSITTFLDRTEFASFGEMVEHTMRFRPGLPVESVRRSVAHNAVRSPAGSWRWRHDRREHPTGDRYDRLFRALASCWEDIGAIACPTLLVVGGDSPIVTADDVAEYRRRNSRIEVAVVDGAGHNVQGDQPAELARLLGDWLENELGTS